MLDEEGTKKEVEITSLLRECSIERESRCTIVVRNTRQTQKSEKTRKKLDSLVTDFLCLPAATATAAAARAQMAGRKSGKELDGEQGDRDAS